MALHLESKQIVISRDLAGVPSWKAISAYTSLQGFQQYHETFKII